MLTEAIRLHAAGALFWVDGTTDRGDGKADAAEGRFLVTVDALPRFCRAEPRARSLVLHAPPSPPLPHAPDEAERGYDGPSAIAVSGTVRAADGRFHPRRFALQVPARTALPVTLYRAPGAAGLGTAGGIILSLRWRDAAAADGIGGPASWALVTLSLAMNGGAKRWRAQADRNGDAILALRGLPPRPKATGPHALTLTVAADPALAGAGIAAAPDWPARPFRAPGEAAAQPSLTLSFTPGDVLRPGDAERHLLLLDPS